MHRSTFKRTINLTLRALRNSVLSRGIFRKEWGDFSTRKICSRLQYRSHYEFQDKNMKLSG